MLSGSHEDRPKQPRVLRGFSHINRYWDRERRCYGAKITPGQFYVSTEGEQIVTVLGSCVSACVRDPIFNIGGMNHFMLPSGENGNWGDSINGSTRYGNFAMEQLVNTILQNGGSRENLEVKLVGGGKILNAMTDIGSKNIEFVREYVKMEGFRVVSEDLGDIYPRKVLYLPDTGKLLVKKLRSLHNTTILEREASYSRDINVEPVSGEIELF
ncbi:MAG: chemoreceptor glutamine deamidase CheD [Gammaproteobacteria bacterium]|nr:chemoreceptor glutamine deamidase CheD [Gammaproteobacteria bacterium]